MTLPVQDILNDVILAFDKDAEVDKEVRGESEESQEILPQMEPTDIDPLEP